MFTKILIVLLATISSHYGYANCFEESKDIDSCLQCCTDTTQTAELVKQYPTFAKEVSVACKAKTASNHVNLASKPAKDLYAKYKIDGSTINLICNDEKFQAPNLINLEAYDECVSKCNEQFPEKKETKKKKP